MSTIRQFESQAASPWFIQQRLSMAQIWPQLNPKHEEEGGLGIRPTKTQTLVLPAYLPLDKEIQYLVQKK